MRLRAPSAPFVSNFFRCGVQGAILPKHLLAGKPDLNRDPFNIKPVGSGPFMVHRYDVNSTIEMVPNPYWFGGKPGLRRVTYRIIPSENTLLVALSTHEIDFYFAAPEQQYRELRALSGVTTNAAPSSQFEMVVFNAGRAPIGRPERAARRRDGDRLAGARAHGLPRRRPRRLGRRLPALVGVHRRSPIRRRTTSPKRARCSTPPAGGPAPTASARRTANGSSSRSSPSPA